MTEIKNVAAQLIPKVRAIPIVANIERILQPYTDFVRGNPILSTAAVGAGTTGLVAAGAAIKSRVSKSKKKKKTKKKRTTKKRKKRTTKKRKKSKAAIRRTRLKNLAKARRARKRGGRRKKKRRIIRGRGLGYGEIKHSGKSTRGKTKIVSFTTKDGKKVRFKVRR